MFAGVSVQRDFENTWARGEPVSIGLVTNPIIFSRLDLVVPRSEARSGARTDFEIHTVTGPGISTLCIPLI